ncbi:uncharacterized protein LOC112601461 [Melanaphis sacchari]|uniref:uncharacterized protein LOC112601461 n=1 Tax=Melanaphis sacchari TaxID=742174 RepID=UPI000DC13811|nr:uncharacterized protein LOC112601461 [Melanaphis sacchari]
MHCSSNYKAQQFYLFYVLLVGIYNIILFKFFSYGNNFMIFLWSLINVLAMVIISQYIICIRMLRDRYKLANIVFKNSLNNPTTTTKYFYPTEVLNLFIELRNLTEEVKTYYAFHALLVIIESVLLISSEVTKLSFISIDNNIKNFKIITLASIFCTLKIIFIFFIVREAHNTIQESKKTVLIAHDILQTTINNGIIKEFEVFVLSYWNNPIIFDVYNFFNLDYKLLQSIIASIVTYLVVLIQIQLAIFMQ